MESLWIHCAAGTGPEETADDVTERVFTLRSEWRKTEQIFFCFTGTVAIWRLESLSVSNSCEILSGSLTFCSFRYNIFHILEF